jgi:hypothetical protein
MKQTITSKQYFTTINLVYYMQAFAVFSFALVVWYLLSQGMEPVANDKMWMVVVPVVMIVGLGSAYFIFRVMLGKIDRSLPLRNKMPKYASALIVRSALLELPGLFAGIAAYMSGHLMHLAGAMIIFMVFMMLRPTRSNIAYDLQLSEKERAQLDKDDEIISEVEKRA